MQQWIRRLLTELDHVPTELEPPFLYRPNTLQPSFHQYHIMLDHVPTGLEYRFYHTRNTLRQYAHLRFI